MTSKDNKQKSSVKLMYSLLVAFGIFTLIGLIGCENEPSNDDNNNQTQQETTMPGTTFIHEGNLTFRIGDSAVTEIEIEIADTEGTITQGLMHRKSMPFNQGMLFIFPDSEPRSFWMKNTVIPLDIIYVSSDLEIVSIKDHTTPFSTDSVPSDNKSAKFVIEVNAGFAGKFGIKEGHMVSFEQF